MKIHLLRHATPVAHVTSGKDFDRPLSEHGKQECVPLGEYLLEHVPPCEVWCSDALRTRQTFEEINKRWQPLSIRFLREFYLAPQQLYLNACNASTGSSDLMIIGHNFGISDLASDLCGQKMTLSPAEFVSLEFEGLSRAEVFPGTGVISSHFLPPADPSVYSDR